MNQIKTLINGQFINTKNSLEVYNPANNELLALVPNIDDEAQINDIFKQAHNAYLKYKDSSIEDRVALLEKFASLIESNKEELATIIMNEVAKGYKDSLVEVERSVEYMRATNVEYLKLIKNPTVFDQSIHGVKNKVATYYRLPVGVVLAISPFNYPINLLISKLAPALVAGNSVVYKPSTQGTMIGIKLAELAHQAGYAPGVINCLTTDARKYGDLLVTNQYVKALSFTGGPKVGNRMAQITSKISLVLELGGKDPALVLDDADLELAANEIVKGAFSYSGQRCTAIKRVFVSSKNHDQLLTLINQKVNQLTVGLPKDNPTIVPLINNNTVKYNIDLLEDAKNKGAVWCQELKVDHNHNLLYPMVVDQVNEQMRIAWEEPFGPILPIIVYNHLDQALELINRSEYGLQASVFTSNLDNIEQLALQIESGTININRSSSRGPDILPFFGVKDSGFGIQGIVDAILSMTTIKGVVINK